VQTAAEIVAEFAARPWRTVPATDLGAAAGVPTMLTSEEGLLYHWLGRRAQGAGVAVDLGAYAGGSAARLLSGLALSGRPFHVHSYDRFRSSRAVDAAKGSAMADHIAAEFFPALVPGRSILIQQDYLMAVQPWLCAQMARLRDQFLPLAHVPKVGLVFLCVSPVTPQALAAARVDGLTDGKLMQRVREAARWHEGMVPRAVFRAMLEQVKAHPGLRMGWQMRQASARARN
jgi:hypothetical protein